MVSSGVALVAGRLAVTAANNAVPTANLLGDGDPQQSGRQHVEISGAKTLLLVGIDPRPGQTTGALADSIIICHIPERHDRAYLISIPRDTRVRIPAFDNGVQRFAGSTQKINAAFSHGGRGLTGIKAREKGVQLLSKTIREAYGIASFDGAAIVDFDGFRSVVSALGGVRFYVDEEVTSIHVGFTKDGTWKLPYHEDANGNMVRVSGVTPVVYRVGERDFTPNEALDYVRQRKLLADGDYGRQRHQQQFLKAVASKLTSGDTLKNPVKLVKVLDAIGDAMTVDARGIPLEDWAFAMRGISAENILTIKSNNGRFNPTEDGQDEVLDETTIELLRSVANGTVEQFVMTHSELVNSA